MEIIPAPVRKRCPGVGWSGGTQLQTGISINLALFVSRQPSDWISLMSKQFYTKDKKPSKGGKLQLQTGEWKWSKMKAAPPQI